MIPTQRSVGVLVKNRVKEIRTIVAEIEGRIRFGYVNTGDNPADCATRGMSGANFESHIWWSGPSFIQRQEEQWPEDSRLFELPQEGMAETAVLAVGATDDLSELLDWKRQRTLASSKRVTAYVLRFIRGVASRVNEEFRKRIERTIPELRTTQCLPYITAEENEMALRVLVRSHQRAHFPPESQKALKQLKLIEDGNGLIRCRGRLGKAELPIASRHPLLIQSKTDFARIITEHAHSPLHCGTAHTMANVRQQFWIPKLRQMARSVIQRCVPCQKMNSLPYKYPEMDDLPSRRVQRTRPFEHVGIDYFGPLAAKHEEERVKVYGIIFTCATTRLMHLELVPDLSTTNLLRALRRFFARRGIPTSITSDNGPNFLLGAQILRDAVIPSPNDVLVAQTMATKGIEWKTITPYAPWQGAMYERLIKSVKHSLYKVLQRVVPEVEDLRTLFVEIEGTLNTRPLTYQEEKWQETPLLRPIDFVQRDMVITYPFESIANNEEDADYLPSSEATLLRTRLQAEEALKSSYQLVERFWALWSQQYLTSLRETHRLEIDKKRGTNKPPTVGDVVLITDAVMPRNSWKMGRIVQLHPSSNNVTREVELRLPNGRTTRRPVNLLVPLELQQQAEEVGDQGACGKSPENETTPHNEHSGPSRYNLRPRIKKSNVHSGRTTTLSSAKTFAMSLLALTMITIIQSASADMSSEHSSHARGRMRCIPGGIQLESQNIRRYELCTKEHCRVKENPEANETILFAPEVTLHEHQVLWKFSDGQRMTTIDTTCPPISFCDNIQCWFCTANIFNPECSPTTAIMASAFLLYGIVATMYLVCYVPIVVGKPCRIISMIVWLFIKSVGVIVRKLLAIVRQRRRRRRPNVNALLRTSIIAACLIYLIETTEACRNIDILHHHTTICSFSPSGSKQCVFENIEIFKLNSYHQEACIRISNNESLVKEIRLQWKELQLTCVKDDILFTRNSVQKVIDSKRCPHSGSCTGLKCASVNTTTKLPELEEGNSYPGVTRCVESCGGPGCGCLLISSGCLFYRVFNVPTDDKVYEIFNCRQWKQRARVTITILNGDGRRLSSRELYLQPTIPLKIEGMDLTMTSVTMPPTPELSSAFISDGFNLAVWKHSIMPSLVCDSEEAARELNCSTNSDCVCEPAESKINCLCNDVNITDVFENELENRLPARRPWVLFEQSKEDRSSVTATIPSFVSVELIIHLKDKFTKTTTTVTDATCKVTDAIVQGCYQCPQGAFAEVTCRTNGKDTMATVRCKDDFFTIPCNVTGHTSTIIFRATTARISRICEVECGSTSTTFELTGTLKWVRTIHESVSRIINGRSNVYDEIVLPDIFHIADIFLTWYKTVIGVALAFVAALFVSYIMFWTCGLTVFFRILKRLRQLVIKLATITFAIVQKLLAGAKALAREKKPPKKRL